MRCDTSGAGYAIYWANVNGKLVVAGDYVTDARKEKLKTKGFDKSFAEESESFALDVNGAGPVAECFNSGKPVFVKSIADSIMKRKDLAAQYGVEQCAFVPMEGGVMEYGTSDGECTANWEEMPVCPTMPKDEMRKGFENLGASYCLFWQNQDGNYKVVAEHTTEARKIALKQVRGDDKTFGSASKAYELPADGNGPVATAFKTGKEVVIDDVSTMKRAAEAKEFGIKRIHFVPTPEGVFEYGTPAGSFLSGALLGASLKMRCDTSGAGYAVYWKEVDGKMTIAGDYVTPGRRAKLADKGFKQSFSDASKSLELSADGDGPVAKVMQNREPFFIADAASSNMKRAALAKQYGIQQICFVPVEGGVMEYGTSDGECTADWKSVEDARTAIMPKSEMKAAFEAGATHMIFWRKVGDNYECGASFVLPERVRALKTARGDDKSYTSESQGMKFPADGQGPIATAARSGKEIVIEDASSAAPEKYKRAGLAKEFNVKNVHFVPCRDGVIEYGVGSN